MTSYCIEQVLGLLLARHNIVWVYSSTRLPFAYVRLPSRRGVNQPHTSLSVHRQDPSPTLQFVAVRIAWAAWQANGFDDLELP